MAWAPGAFELPLVAQGLRRAGAVDAVVCLGAVIRGDTGHYDFVAGECAAGHPAGASSTPACPVVFGVLTTDDRRPGAGPVRARETNKGREAALTAVEMVRLLRRSTDRRGRPRSAMI